MIDQAGGSGSTNLAQEGWAKYSAWSKTAPFWFWECESCKYSSDGSTVPSGPHEYGTQMQDPTNTSLTDRFTGYKNSQGVVDLQVKAVNDTIAENDAYVKLNGWNITDNEWFGETTFQNNQIPGDTSEFQVFANPQYLNGSTWTAINPTTVSKKNDFPGSWGRTLLSNGFWIWDTRWSNDSS